jgi:hypothetical protein
LLSFKDSNSTTNKHHNCISTQDWALGNHFLLSTAPLIIH